MTTAADVIRVATAEIGYIETGGANNDSGNRTKYWQDTDPAFQGEPWCADWLFARAAVEVDERRCASLPAVARARQGNESVGDADLVRGVEERQPQVVVLGAVGHPGEPLAGADENR